MATSRSQQNESHEGLVRLVRACVGHRRLILGIFAKGILVATIVGCRLPRTYRASALVLVEDEMPRIVGVQGLMSPEAPRGRYYQTQCMLLTSRNVLSAAAERLQLATWSEFSDARDIVAALADRVVAAPVYNTELIRLSAEGPDRQRVDDMANVIVECFREESIRRRKQSSALATGWIGEQIPRLRAEVAAAEERLRAFQEKHRILSPSRDRSVVSQRLVQLNKDVTSAEKARIELEAELAQASPTTGDPEGVEFLPALASSPAISRLDSELLAFRNDRLDLLRTLKPEHRDVKSLDAKIASFAAERRKRLTEALSALERRVGAARLKERALREALADQEKKALALNEKLIRLNVLQRDVERAKQLYEPLLDRWGKIDLASGLNAVPVQIIEHATEPHSPVKPRKGLIIATGALLGLLAGLQLALVLDRSCSKVRSPEDLERAAALKTLGSIPHIGDKDERKRYLACRHDPKSAAAEAYRSVRTGLLVARNGNGSAVLLVTSAMGSEGKTTTALNVSSALAQSKKRVLIVDADLRKPFVNRPLGLDRGPGLSACLAEGVDAEDVVRETEIPCLHVVTGGKPPDNPAELLGSSRMAAFVDWARDNFDFVVIDSPPVAAVTDSNIIAPLADGVLMVVRADHTPRRAVVHGHKLLQDAQGKVIGAILNDVPRRYGRYYGYGYGYGYYQYGYPGRAYGAGRESVVTASG